MPKTDAEQAVAFIANRQEVLLHLYGLMHFAEESISRDAAYAEVTYQKCWGFKKNSLKELVEGTAELLKTILL